MPIIVAAALMIARLLFKKKESRGDGRTVEHREVNGSLRPDNLCTRYAFGREFPYHRCEWALE
jgi:hypothetical protein